MTDEHIKKRVVDQLVWDDRIDASRIEVYVSGGRVRLEGDVPSLQSKEAVEEDVLSTLGVISVTDHLKVKPQKDWVPPSDEEVKARILNRFSWDPDLDPSTLQVDVKDGMVTLNGTTPSYWLMQRSERLASELEGVMGVENHVAVVPSEHPVDQRVAREIMNSLERRANVDADTIVVNVEEGKATLVGHVPDWHSLRSAQQAAELTRGVAHVDNRLTID